ncbi:NAD-dependent protein deacylase [Staphylococcus equorum]|uniref:NAD-dependent protein deacylase n=1 Tax=Staphylococcus equorum TaxID=246432 RepID=UPI0003A99910|nr:NAD-dependent protein deacylase [Staphylococcus equorum]ANR69351.1 NAD-dependent deacetylase [Staphylococcus equorum]KKI53920.1 NAD-dependent protein deacetylase of SIR2 family [Staphylococcus equorum subsp. equorum]MCE5007613.1 NAD-dependent protein deacylase [Staphylococcus equorum]MDK9852446.1 NAD-dependent protein deacylase [Staphylococcus equorum]MDK9861363.1 NAD-dependent protein deacylase [Staphylococcus equorum]
MNDRIEQFKNIINDSNKITFFTGAGVSVASGVPDFRSMGGLFDEISKDGYAPEYLLSTDYLQDDPVGFVDFYHKRLLLADKQPNLVHQWIAQLEQDKRSLGVITQNIDGLHSDAGSLNVDELHGTLNHFYCIDCHKAYFKDYVMKHHLRECEVCGSPIRPDIVLYGELLNQNTIYNALDKIKEADTLVVLGSSLVVQPAAGLISKFQGQNLVIINKDHTPYDNHATLVIHDDMVKVVNELGYVE